MDKYYVAIKNTIQEGIIVFDSASRVLDINKNIEMIMDCILDENCTLDRILSHKISTVINEMAELVMRDGFSVPRPIIYINKNNVRMPFLVSVEPLEENVFIAVLKELISNEEMHKIAWENELKKHYISKISKGLYLPLHNMKRDLEYAEGALHAEETTSAKEFLSDAQNELAKMERIFEDLLDLSIIDTVANKLLFKRISLEDILRKVIGIASADFSDVVLDAVPGKYDVLGDVRSLEYLFLSLIDQFLQTSRSNDTIRVRIMPVDGGIEITLSNGAPIDKSFDPLLLDPDNPMDSQNIKLDIARWIISVHNIELIKREVSLSLLLKKEE